jgi:hypothetical protein
MSTDTSHQRHLRHSGQSPTLWPPPHEPIERASLHFSAILLESRLTRAHVFRPPTTTPVRGGTSWNLRVRTTHWLTSMSFQKDEHQWQPKDNVWPTSKGPVPPAAASPLPNEANLSEESTGRRTTYSNLPAGSPTPFDAATYARHGGASPPVTSEPGKGAAGEGLLTQWEAVG